MRLSSYLQQQFSYHVWYEHSYEFFDLELATLIYDDGLCNNQSLQTSNILNVRNTLITFNSLFTYTITNRNNLSFNQVLTRFDGSRPSSTIILFAKNGPIPKIYVSAIIKRLSFGKSTPTIRAILISS